MSWIGQIAYEAWVSACGRTGVTITKSWVELLDDERYQWDSVAETVIRASSSTTGTLRNPELEETLPPPPPAATDRAPSFPDVGGGPEGAADGNPPQKGR